MIAILDYKAGNQTSVLRALNFLNIEACITDKSETLMQADGVIRCSKASHGQTDKPKTR
jgi:glutamine amidotransferase